MTGILPQTFTELSTPGKPTPGQEVLVGKRVTPTFDPRIEGNRFETIRMGTWLFAEYLYAMSDGRLAMVIKQQKDLEPLPFRIAYFDEIKAAAIELQPTRAHLERHAEAAAGFDMALTLYPEPCLKKPQRLGRGIYWRQRCGFLRQHIVDHGCRCGMANSSVANP